MLALVRVLCALFGLTAALALGANARASAPLCPPGQASATGFEPCEPCPPGTVTEFGGQTSCIPCDPGSFQGSQGGSLCDFCPSGTFASATGATACEPCPPGRYFDSVQAAECLACAPGTFAAGTGNTTCSLCARGTYAEAAATECTPCAPGRFTPFTGAASCAECPAGTAQPDSGETSCVDCAAGTHQPSSGAVACLACPRDTYAPQTSAVTCLECGCNDGVACTRDACEPIEGACSASPVSGCEVQRIAFDGVVAEVADELAACFAVGAPFSGSFELDPEAPDEQPTNLGEGLYRAIDAFELRLVRGEDELDLHGIDPQGVDVSNDYGLGDLVSFGTNFDAPIPGCGSPLGVTVNFADVGGSTLATDALVFDAARLNEFPTSYALLSFPGADEEHPLLLEADIVSVVPEPVGAAPCIAVAATLAVLTRARSSASQRRRA